MGNFRSFGNNGSRGGGFGGGGGNRGGFGGRRGGFGGGFNREERRMFGATCAECGENCEVPFKPDGSKPVLCSSCFKNEKGGDNRRFSAFEDFEDRKQKFEAVCSACGKNCEIPFKPKEGKPVYCSECFGKSDKKFEPRKSEAPVSNKEFEKLNMKLDAVLKRLDLLLPAASVEIPAETSTEVTAKDATKKAVKAKKAPAKKAVKKAK